MQIEITFDAAELLNSTSLKQDHSDVWARYLNNRVVRFGKRVGAVVNTEVGRCDLLIIRDYLSLWLCDQELVPDHLRDREDDRAMRTAREAIYKLSAVIDAHQYVS